MTRATTSHAPVGGIERGGWKLVYNDRPNLFGQALEKLVKFADFSYSLGFTVAADGKSMTETGGAVANTEKFKITFDRM